MSHNMFCDADTVLDISHKISTKCRHDSILIYPHALSHLKHLHTVELRKMTRYFTFINFPSNFCKFMISGCIYMRCFRRRAPVGKESSPSYIVLHSIKYISHAYSYYLHGFFPSALRSANCSFNPACNSSGVVRGTPSPTSRR